jgi:hypothetical protein
VVPVNSLRKPRQERVRFSGGYNISAQERNAKALSAAKVVYRIGNDIHVPGWYYPEFARELEIALSTSAERAGPAMTIEVRKNGFASEAPFTELDSDHPEESERAP